jgi:hypothetical protein
MPKLTVRIPCSNPPLTGEQVQQHISSALQSIEERIVPAPEELDKIKGDLGYAEKRCKQLEHE